jgi:hypothetical protein
MKKNLLSFTLLSFALLFCSCGSNKDPKEEERELSASYSEPQFDMAPAEIQVPVAMNFSAGSADMPQYTSVQETMDMAGKDIENQGMSAKKKIIRDGSISIKAEELEKSKQGIDALVKQYNAYYENEVFQNNATMVSYNLKIRIPAEKFEAFLTSVESSGGEITGKNIRTTDVTEEYVDIETRLNNKKAYLKRYLELLGKAANVKDIIDIEENIRVLQEEIESKEGRLKYLNDQVAFSTLNVNLHREKEYEFKPGPQDSFKERFKTSVYGGWYGLVGFTLGLIRSWPLLLLMALIIVLLVRRYKKRKLRN